MDKPPPNKPGGKKTINLAQFFQARPTQVPRTVKKSPAAVQGEPLLDWKQLFLMVSALVALVVLSYANTLPAHPVFNDTSTLSFLRSVGNWDVFWDGLWGEAFFSPLSQQWLKATYAWDYGAAASGWWWYHVVNIGLHLVSCIYLFVLLFCVSRQLKNQNQLRVNPYYVAFLSSALFAVHPLTSESVAYISGRVGPLLAANYFLALDCFLFGYLRRGTTSKIWGYGLAVLFTGIGLMVSPDALTIPITMLVLSMLLKNQHESWRTWLVHRGILVAVLVLAGSGLPYLLLRGTILQAGNGAGLPTLPPMEYLSSQLKGVLTYYVRCFIVPVGMAVDPPGVIARSLSDPGCIAGICFLVACLAGLWFFRSKPLVVLGLFLFLIGFIPSSLIAQPEVIADHRVYLSLSGLCLLAGYGLSSLAAISFRRAAIIFAAAMAVLIGLTIWRNTDWQSNYSLWQSTLRVNPSSARAHAMMSMEMLRLGQNKSALAEARKALDLDPSSVPAFIAVGGTLLNGKDYSGAAEAFKHAVELGSHQVLSRDLQYSVQVGLAESLFENGDRQGALSVAQQAMEMDPSDPVIRVLAGKCLLSLKKPDKALAELELAAKIDPGLSSIWQPLAEAALEMDTPAVAYQAAEILQRIDKSDSSKLLMARAAAANRKYDESMRILESLQKSDTKNATVFALSSLVEKRLGHSDKTEGYKNRALDLDKSIFSTVRLQADSDAPAAK